ncbi:hypothetical protein J3486_29830, partial [Streptomyces sp. VRA16 Mangrove soil]|nr:hypothetical protein [Streptomyces sp. VRA16 Mangrove soil]
MSREGLAQATRANGTCTGTFTGTHLRLVDGNGVATSKDTVVKARVAGDIAVLAGGDLVGAYAPVAPSCTTALTGASPKVRTLRVVGPRPSPPGRTTPPPRAPTPRPPP